MGEAKLKGKTKEERAAKSIELRKQDFERKEAQRLEAQRRHEVMKEKGITPVVPIVSNSLTEETRMKFARRSLRTSTLLATALMAAIAAQSGTK